MKTKGEIVKDIQQLLNRIDNPESDLLPQNKSIHMINLGNISKLKFTERSEISEQNNSYTFDNHLKSNEKKEKKPKTENNEESQIIQIMSDEEVEVEKEINQTISKEKMEEKENIQNQVDNKEILIQNQDIKNKKTQKKQQTGNEKTSFLKEKDSVEEVDECTKNEKAVLIQKMYRRHIAEEDFHLRKECNFNLLSKTGIKLWDRSLRKDVYVILSFIQRDNIVKIIAKGVLNKINYKAKDQFQIEELEIYKKIIPTVSNPKIDK